MAGRCLAPSRAVLLAAACGLLACGERVPNTPTAPPTPTPAPTATPRISACGVGPGTGDGFVVSEVQAQELCATVDGGNEIAVKKTNDFNDQYHIMVSDGHNRRGEVSYRATCYPAWF